MLKIFKEKHFVNWEDYMEKISTLELFLWQQSVLKEEMKT